MANKRRLIDADELRRRILAFATGLHSEVLPVDTVIMLLTQMQDVDPVRRWIPVKERMPEYMEPVIVCRDEGKVEQGYKDVKDWWKVYGTRTKRVTHWMPLPQPPKEEKHE